MIEYVKSQLIENVDKLIELLEYYGYRNFKKHSNYLTFGRDSESSPKALVIRFENNEHLYVKDYARNLNCDVFNLIIKQRNVEFRDVFLKAKNLLGIEGYYQKEERYKPFGGFYDKIKRRKQIEIPIYDVSILNKYSKLPNMRFLKDGINCLAQNFFQIGYDIESQAITIPIFDEVGNLIGVKARINRDPTGDEQKYYYLIPCLMTQTLYGYSHNYEYLESAKDIYIFESEKSVMQTYSMGYRNCVSLGSSSLSKKQAQLLLSLNPENIVLMFDKGLKREAIERNVQVLKTYGRHKDFNIKIWIPSDDVPDKASASDLGKEKFEEILRTQIVLYEEDI